MRDSRYPELESLIKEYEEDSRTIKSERLIMKNYPKVFTMSAASSFEYQIKRRCQEFLDALGPAVASYPNICILRQRKPKEDQMFAKLEGYLGPDGERLNAEKFYELFGGQTFKEMVEEHFFGEKAAVLEKITTKIAGLSALLGQEEQYAFEYAKQSDLKENIEHCSFADAEQAYLRLKLRRNRVAHDYINGLSDTFEDIQKFYHPAVLYVVALELSIQELTPFYE